ncbi:MAG: lipopolysaccharide transport periplasmic protein LptA [Gallionellaceae bacterium]|nr:lipopolysaccharide transport periplasmic protein LptA [Gallionellaceae bacterium]
MTLTLALALLLACAPAHADRADRNQPVHLEADQVKIDDTKQISTFDGRVQLRQGTALLRADTMVVTQDASGNMHGTATGQPASFRQKREGLNEYIDGYAQRIEYDTATDTVHLYGQARITRGADQVRGDHISYNSRTEIFQVHGADAVSGQDQGRVHIVIQPKPKPETNEALPIKPADTLGPADEDAP